MCFVIPCDLWEFPLWLSGDSSNMFSGGLNVKHDHRKHHMDPLQGSNRTSKIGSCLCAILNHQATLSQPYGENSRTAEAAETASIGGTAETVETAVSAVSATHLLQPNGSPIGIVMTFLGN